MNLARGIDYTLRITVLLGCLLLSVFGYVLYERTIIDWWLPVGAALMMATFMSPLISKFSRFLTKSQSKWLNTVCSLAVAGTLSYFSLLGCNYWFSDPASEHKENAVVIEKIKDKRQKYRRVGRNRMVSTGEYTYSYYLVVEFDDGKVKKIPASAKAYSRSRTGSTRTYTLRDGLLGYKVVK